jgi:dTDP-4-amino-4,6-dideoxygalactose transaminase
MSKLALLGGEPVRQKPFPSWPVPSPNDHARLAAVLDSGNWGGFPFPNTHASLFATQFAARHGARFGCAVASGTVALLAALKGVGIQAGDHVIVPAYTWDGTAVAVLQAGAVPVFADVLPDTWCLDPNAARQALTPNTRALLPVHLAMRCADMDALLALARHASLKVVEDCAHAHGAVCSGKAAGSAGDAGAFSFQSSKLMTSGEGGIVITSDELVLATIMAYVNCGRVQSLPPAWPVTGANFRLTEFQAALLLGQLEQLDARNSLRHRNALRLAAGLSQFPQLAVLPPQPNLSAPAIYAFVFRYLESHRVPRDLFVAALEAEGIPCDGRFYEPVYRSDLFRPSASEFPQLRGIDYRSLRCPVTERLAEHEAVWLLHFLLLGSDDDIDDILRAVDKVLTHLPQLERADPSLAGLKALPRSGRARLERRNY